MSSKKLPTKNNNITNDIPSVRKRKADALSTEKQPKTIRQGSWRHSVEREDVQFYYPFDPFSSLHGAK